MQNSPLTALPHLYQTPPTPLPQPFFKAVLLNKGGKGGGGLIIIII